MRAVQKSLLKGTIEVPKSYRNQDIEREGGCEKPSAKTELVAKRSGLH